MGTFRAFLLPNPQVLLITATVANKEKRRAHWKALNVSGKPQQMVEWHTRGLNRGGGTSQKSAGHAEALF